MIEPVLNQKHPLGIGDEDRHLIYRFPNGYGASVVRFPGSYGYHSEKWELAVITFKSEDNTDFDLNYTHPESHGDVRGYLTEEEVQKILVLIQGVVE